MSRKMQALDRIVQNEALADQVRAAHARIAELEAKCKGHADVIATERQTILAALEILVDPIPGAAVNAVRSDYPKLATLVDKIIAHAKREQMEAINAALRGHYLAGIICRQDDKTDVAMCACSLWRCDPQPNVGDAVQRWIEHVADVMAKDHPEEK